MTKMSGVGLTAFTCLHSTGAVTLTVIQGIPQADRLLEALARHRLDKLVRSAHHERD